MKNKKAKQIFIIGEVIVLIMAIVLAVAWKNLPPQLPWFYSLPSGEQQLASKIVLAISLAVAGISLAITRMVARWASSEDIPVEITIVTGGLVAVVLLAAGFFRVIQIILGL